MKVVEISEKKIDKMSELVEDMLLAGGELMHCITKLSDEMYGERSPMDGRYRRSNEMFGERGYMGMRGGRNLEDDGQDMWGERRYTRRMR